MAQAPTFKDQVVSTANEVVDAGMFWRGNLAKAVRRRDFKGTIWGVAALAFFLFLYVWQHLQVVKLGYEVQALKVQKEELSNQYYYLQYKLHDVDSLARVETIAQTQLGMTTPRSDQVVILKDSESSTPRWLAAWTGAVKNWGLK
ncbi:MAG TPA: cell division protein FtsL [bacterium]|nr:cell division protein FtsL [bacterium]